MGSAANPNCPIISISHEKRRTRYRPASSRFSRMTRMKLRAHRPCGDGCKGWRDRPRNPDDGFDL